MVQVYIALGSNLNTPTEQLNSALEAISSLPNTELKIGQRILSKQTIRPARSTGLCECGGDDRNHSPTFSLAR